jgi:amidohydrolase
MNMELSERIKQLSIEYNSRIIELYQELHANPELSFQEYGTAARVSRFLDKLGIPYEQGIAETGVIGIIQGGKPGPLIAIRAELDALPVYEKTNLEFASRDEGVMHACGHDLHMANLLGAAMILNDLRDDIYGGVLLVFQPAEELLPGGALDIIQSEFFRDNKPDFMMALHVLPELEAGKVGFRPGPYMASGDELYIKVKGKGGHAALRNTLIDPILIASQIVIELQKINQQGVEQNIPTVLSIGKFIAQGATNIIPDEVNLEGTFRTMNEEWRYMVHELIRSISGRIANEMGGECEVEVVGGYPSVVNNVKLTEMAASLAATFLGNDKVIELPLRMTTDDFAYYSQIIPSVYFRVGVGFPNLPEGRLHSGTFVPNEDALENSVALTAWLAMSILAQKANE